MTVWLLTQSFFFSFVSIILQFIFKPIAWNSCIWILLHPLSKILHRVLYISNALALKYAFLKIVLENDGISGRILILSSSLLIFLTTLVDWLWLFTTISRRLYSMKTLGISSFPLSKFHILLYGTNNFLSVSQLRPVHEALSF